MKLIAQENSISSPDGTISIEIRNEEQLTYSVKKGDQTLIFPSAISLVLSDGTILGRNATVEKVSETSVNEEIIPIVAEKYSSIPNVYKEIHLIFKEDFSLRLRAYNDAVAYRFETSFPEDITIKSEEVTFHVAGNWPMIMGEEESFISHCEKSYQTIPLNEFSEERKAILPVTIEVEGGTKMAIVESGLEDYPGMIIQGSETDGQLNGIFAPYPLSEKRVPFISQEIEFTDKRNFYPDKTANYIAKVKGTRNFPWRGIMVSENAARLLENQLVFKLGDENRISDADWIKPGKVVWDWLSDNNLYGVDFKSGINTDTYKYLVDFASQYGLDYVILDEGWSPTTDVLTVVPDLNMEALTTYAEEKGVGLILWVIWKSLDEKLIEALDLYESWGVKGIKVDFMQRDDQPMVNFYWRVAEECAKRKMLVDFHGSYKPSGMRRTYPNVITREGVKGSEVNKWGKEITPTHNVTIPFTRMLAGPMDYTPGLMDNTHSAGFFPRWSRPMSQGTRAHQLAMYVIFESPLQMLADNASHYLNEPNFTKFLSQIPTTWDETRVIEAEIGQYIVIARRSGDIWYLGGMTNETARAFSTSLDFLSDGTYKMDGIIDGVNADRFAKDIKFVSSDFTKGEQIQCTLTTGGGFVMIFKP